MSVARLNNIKHIIRQILQGREFTKKESENLLEYVKDELKTRTRLGNG
jgi:hypothetical protein